MTPDLPDPSESQALPAIVSLARWEGRLFGTFRLFAPDGADATPAGRKARALVAYLLSAMDDGATRERLAGLLWSERGDDQARGSLRQTFYELRGLTAGDAPPIVVDRTRVALVGHRVTTDGSRLDDAAQAEDAAALAAVVGHHPAEFLADLDGIDPAYDDWLSIERTLRRDARRRALLAVADRRLAVGDADAAQLLAERLLACDPADEAAARIAMQASYRRGDRDAIRRHFASLTDALRRQVGVAPSDESDEAYRRAMTAPRPDDQRLPGAREVLPANGDIGASATPLGEAEAPAAIVVLPAPATNASWARWPRRWTLLAAGVALLTVAVVELVGWRNTGAAAMQRILLIEPMRVAPGDAAAAALGSGFSAELARLVVERPAFVVREARPAPVEASDRTFVVATDAQSEGGVLHVGLRLLGREGGQILWSATLARPAAEVVALREQMAAKLADVAFCALDGRHTDLRTFRPETLQLLLGACDLRHTDSRETTRLLERLTHDVPGFSHGWALLAASSAGNGDDIATVASGDASRTDAYVRRAIALDPHDGDAYLGRAFAVAGIARWPQAVAALRAGLAQNPDNADLAIALAGQLARLGHLQQAIAWSERAIREDPFSPLVAREHAKVLGSAGIAFGPEASGAFEDARRRFGTDDASLALAEFRYQALFGDHHRAARILADPNRGFHLHPDRAALWGALIETRADPSAAHDAEAVRAFDASMRAIPDINPWTLETLSFLHHVDEAYAEAGRMPERADADTDSLFGAATRPLRADPRFMTLAARLGLADVWKATGQWPDFCGEPDLGYDCRVEANRALSANPRPFVSPR